MDVLCWTVRRVSMEERVGIDGGELFRMTGYAESTVKWDALSGDLSVDCAGEDSEEVGRVDRVRLLKRGGGRTNPCDGLNEEGRTAAAGREGSSKSLCKASDNAEDGDEERDGSALGLFVENQRKIGKEVCDSSSSTRTLARGVDGAEKWEGLVAGTDSRRIAAVSSCEVSAPNKESSLADTCVR